MILGWDMLQITCGECEKYNQKRHAREKFNGEYLKLLNYIEKNTVQASLKISLSTNEARVLKKILRTLWSAQTFSLPKSFDVLESLHA